MSFALHSEPTVRQIARIALDCYGDPQGIRILGHKTPTSMVIDEVRDAYVFTVNSTFRHNSIQCHFMMFFFGRFFHIRTRSVMSHEVGFYDFPETHEAKRSDIQKCFMDAMAVHGRNGKAIQGPFDKFEPVFAADDWEPPDF